MPTLIIRQLKMVSNIPTGKAPEAFRLGSAKCLRKRMLFRRKEAFGA